MYPFLDLTQSHTSNVLFAEGYFLTAQHLLWYGRLYVRNQSDYLDPIASPLLAADSTLQGMAPTLVLTAEMDPLRDEGEEYASRLSGVGVPTKMIRFDATVHAYMFLPCQAQKSSVQELKAWLSTYAFGHHTMREQPFHATEAASSAVSSEL
jgi:acetyl esterase